MRLRQPLLLIMLLVFCIESHAGEVEIVKALFVRQGKAWRVETTLHHTDSGWQHYANAWRIVGGGGKVLSTRVLAHPHVHEQPFTRSLHSVVIPRQVTVVFIEARDKVHGWSKQRLRVDLTRKRGDRFRVIH